MPDVRTVINRGDPEPPTDWEFEDTAGLIWSFCPATLFHPAGWRWKIQWDDDVFSVGHIVSWSEVSLVSFPMERVNG